MLSLATALAGLGSMPATSLSQPFLLLLLLPCMKREKAAAAQSQAKVVSRRRRPSRGSVASPSVLPEETPTQPTPQRPDLGLLVVGREAQGQECSHARNMRGPATHRQRRGRHRTIFLHGETAERPAAVGRGGGHGHKRWISKQNTKLTT